MLLIFQTLLHGRHTKPIEARFVIEGWPTGLAARDLPEATPAGGGERLPVADLPAADGLAHYIDSRLADGRFRID